MLLDPLDAKILRLLREDARLSYRDIAEKAESTVPTVSARVKALEDIGVIRGYRAEIDLTLTGGALVHVNIQTKPSEARTIANVIAQTPGVVEVVLLAGGQIHARVRLRTSERTLEHLHDALAEHDGITRYEVSEVLAAPATALQEELPERVDVKCHQCQGPIHDAPVRKTLGERVHVFCCRHCQAAFTERYEKMGTKAKALKHHH